MKKTVSRVVALACGFMLLFTALFAMPVYALGGDTSDYILDDYLGGYPGWVWDIIYRNIQIINYGNMRPMEDYVLMPDELTTEREYYTDNSVPTQSGSIGNGWGSTTAYNTGNTTKAPIINKTYNNTTNNYDYKYYDITNNTYHNITNNITYNNTYNTYNFQTNNYNYYITYAPTFVNITYLNGASGELNNQTYFYKLPDGRNSWDLHAEDVFGMYFIYDALNYDMVIEDDATLALYHFDGDLKDESAYNGTASYRKGASYNYYDHGAFGSALYWDGSEHELGFNGVSGGGTYEFMWYLTESGTIAENTRRFKFLKSYLSQEMPSTVPARQGVGTFINQSDERLHYCQQTGSKYIGNGGSSTYITDYQTDYYWTVYYVAGYMLNMGGTGYFPIYEKLSITEKTNNGYTSYTYSGASNYHYRRQSWTVTAGKYVLAYPGSDGTMIEVPPGTWHYMAVCGGSTYMDGLTVPFRSGASDVSGLAFYMPPFGNYSMIDEFRVSSGSLFSGSYTPPNAPYDTNKVMVLPDSATDGDIAVKSIIPVTDMRVGGARPTYPNEGDVFVAVDTANDKHTVEAVQQYQAGGWVAVDASIRTGGEWKQLKNYDLKTYTASPVDPGGDDSSGGSSGGSSSGGSSTPGGDDDGDDGFWSWIGNGIKDLFGGLFNLIGSIIGGLLSLVGKLLTSIVELIANLFDALFELVGFSTRFGEFVGSAFGFIPSEIIGVIVVGLSLAIILMIINFFR